MAGDTDNSCNKCGLVIQVISAMLQHRRHCSPSSSSSLTQQNDSLAASRSSLQDVQMNDEYLIISPSKKRVRLQDRALHGGMVVKVIPEKGFGFIKPDDDKESFDKDVFFHVRNVVNTTQENIVMLPGSIVQFGLNETPKDESKPEATVIYVDVESSKKKLLEAKKDEKKMKNVKVKNKPRWIEGSIVTVRQDKNFIFIKPFKLLPEKYAQKDVFARFNMIPDFLPQLQQG